MQQAIIWANVNADLYRHIMSLGHNELTHHPWNVEAHICMETKKNMHMVLCMKLQIVTAKW